MILATCFINFISISAQAGGYWNDQYCNIEVTQVELKNTKGETIDLRTEEKTVCFDGVKDFLHESGIADSCEMFNWDMPLNGQLVNMRSVACKKINEEGYEIVPGYYNIN